MWSLKAWGQGTGAPAHRQVVQGPAPNRGGKGRHADVADLITAQKEYGALWERPAPHRGGKGGDADVTDGVEGENE
jgi:hypothetical protein